MWSPGEEQIVGDALNEAGLPKVITETLTPESSHSQKQLGVGASALFLRLVIAHTLYMLPSRSGDESENEKVESIPVLPDPLPLLQTLYETRYAPEHKRYACGGRGTEADMAFNPSRCPRFVTLKDTDMQILNAWRREWLGDLQYCKSCHRTMDVP
jgi:hypothetical protein